MDEDKRQPFWVRCGDTTPRDVRNLRSLIGTLLVWAVCFVGGSQVIKRDLLPAGALPWLVAAVPTIVGVFVLAAYARFIRQADELQRAIQLQALALGFGVGWLAIAGYPIFERLGAPALDVGDYVVVMAVSYALGSLLGWRRYR